MAGVRVGFIGVGLMGWGMARNVLAKGFRLSVMAHRKREAIDDLVQRGADEVQTAAEMTRRSDFVVLCVTGTPQVEDLIYRDDGVLAGAHAGLTIIDTSTCEPDSTERLQADLASHGVSLIDAPLSRTPDHAWRGELTSFVGGPEELVERCRPIIETWASVIIPTGAKVGSAHAVKLVNNLVSIGYSALWSECYAMVAKLGMEPGVFREIVSNSGMNCGNFQNYSKYVCDGDPQGHKFSLANCLKDMSYYERLASRHKAVTPISDGALLMLRIGHSLGLEDRYMPEFYDIFARVSGLPDAAM